MGIDISGMKLTDKNQNTGRETSPGATVPTANSMLTGLESSADIRYERRPTDTLEKLAMMKGYC